MPPATIGYKAYEAYPAGPNGDVAKAKELLGGQTPELVLGVADNSTEQQQGAQLKANLERAGFKITLRNISDDAKLDEIKKKNNPGTCTSVTGRRTGRAGRRSCRCSTTAGPSRPRATATSPTSTTRRSTPRWTASWRCPRPSRARSGPSSTSGS
ncbi:hypothetical protein NKG94_41920 [Micromonospora sp. M12]